MCPLQDGSLDLVQGTGQHKEVLIVKLINDELFAAFMNVLQIHYRRWIAVHSSSQRVGDDDKQVAA